MNIKKSNIIALVILLVLAAGLLVLRHVFLPRDSALQFFGYYTVPFAMTAVLVMIGSIVLTGFVFKLGGFGKSLKNAMLFMLCAVFVIIAVNPLRWPPALLRSAMLLQTPKGTDMETVIKIIESKDNWETHYISYEYGYTRPGAPSPGQGTTIGDKSIRVYMGAYRIIFFVDVTVLYGFDENAKLMDIYIWHDGDVF